MGDEEEEARAMDLLTRYNKILNTLTDNCMKAEQLCMCWDKLDQDTKELTSAMKCAGGTRKLSMAELEDSLAQIKEMLKERSNIIERRKKNAKLENYYYYFSYSLRLDLSLNLLCTF